MLTFWRTFFNVDEPGAATPPAVPAPEPVAPPELTGPWAKDLNEFFAGKETIGVADVDRFMAEKYQPYVTRIEQESAPARELLNDLNTDFEGTMAAIVGEYYGEDDSPNEALANRFLELVKEGATPEAAAAAVVEEQPTALPPEVQEIVNERQEAKQRTAYETAVNELKTRVADAEFDDAEFAPFVVTANGDLDQAYAGYKAWRDAVRAKYGTPVTPPEVPTPPAALGTSGTGGTPTPPVTKQYHSFDEAFEDWRADERAKAHAPTTVGSV